jgi:hypothetical protein
MSLIFETRFFRGKTATSESRHHHVTQNFAPQKVDT